MLSLGRNEQRSCKKSRASTIHGLSSSGRYQLNLRFGLLFRMINCITIFFASASSWGTQSHRNAALERRDHWDTGTNPPRQVIIMWLSWEQAVWKGGRMEGRGAGVGSDARIPAPILRQCRILNFVNLYHPEYRFFLSQFVESHFLTERSNPVSPKTFWEFPNHDFGQIPDHKNALFERVGS